MDGLDELNDMLELLKKVDALCDDLIYGGILEAELYDIQFSVQQTLLTLEDLIQEETDSEDLLSNGFQIEEYDE